MNPSRVGRESSLQALPAPLVAMDKKSRPNHVSRLQKSAALGPRFLLWFVPLAILLSAVFFLFHRQEVAYEVSALKSQQRDVVQREKRHVENLLAAPVSDTLVLAQNPLLMDLPDPPTAEQMESATRLLLGLARNKPVYAQVRFIDAKGHEVIRIQRAPGGAFAVPAAELQDKSDRYYVRQAWELGPDQVYVSRLDLNQERGKLETPFQPTLRMAAVVRDGRGGRRGLVVINYLGQRILDALRLALLARGHLELVNQEGYWLWSPRQEDQWGFMIPARAQARLDLRHPGIWQEMQGRGQGQFFSELGLTTFIQIRLPGPLGSQRSWYLLSRVEPAGLDQVLGVYLRSRLITLAGLLLIAALACWLLARNQARRRLAEAKVQTDAENQRALRMLLGLRISSEPVPALMEQALKIVFSISWLSTMPKGGVFLSEPGPPPCLRLVAHRNLDSAILSLCARVDWGQCHCGQAAASGQIQHCGHVGPDHTNRFQGMADHGHYNLPLMRGDLCLGVMVLYLAAGQERHQAEIDFLDAVSGVLASILDSRAREEVVQESEARLSAIVDTAVEGIITIDAESRVLSFNPGAERIFGYGASEVVGRQVHMLQPEPIASQHQGYLRRYLETGESHIIGIGREVTGRRKDGSLFPLYLSVSEIRLGPRTLFTGILRDITELKQAQRRLQEAKEQAESTNRELTAKQKLLDQDMEAAAGIQQALLPSDLPLIKELELAWRFIPSQHIGGDMLSVSLLSPRHLGLYLLDVSGHGVPSALVTVSVHEMLQPASGHVVEYREDGSATVVDPRWVADLLDQEYPLERFDKFFTLFYAVLDLDSGRLTYTNAGHPSPWVIRADGQTVALETGGTVIGMGQAGGFEQGEVVLAPGDRLFCYTDGITEHASPQGELYGAERLRADLEQRRDQALGPWIAQALETALAFGPQGPPQDDISILAARYQGREKG